MAFAVSSIIPIILSTSSILIRGDSRIKEAVELFDTNPEHNFMLSPRLITLSVRGI
jgi:hypothetical protein